MLGLCAIIAVTGGILVKWSNDSAGLRSYVPVYSLLLLTAILSGPFPFLAPPSFQTAKTWRLSPNDPSCPSDTNFLDQACFHRGDFRKLSSVSSPGASRSAGSHSVAVFPS